MKRILVTGPESTGKTELTRYLAEHFKGRCVPEYAREFIEQLNRPYIYNDVVKIAKQQRSEYHKTKEKEELVFFDTWLMVTKVWFELVFDSIPAWIEDELQGASFDLVLVCAPDIPWEPDPVRENGGAERERLYERYIDEIERLEWRYAIVKGMGEERKRNAITIVHEIGEVPPLPSPPESGGDI